MQAYLHQMPWELDFLVSQRIYLTPFKASKRRMLVHVLNPHLIRMFQPLRFRPAMGFNLLAWQTIKGFQAHVVAVKQALPL
ncbi:hypothetical protein, partial [Salmonella sp. s57936]|uniref:hypothetical protein n=1 Tax=Salmonella sp. s57936 TaxID=3159698 RepID=UPI00397EDAF2